MTGSFDKALRANGQATALVEDVAARLLADEPALRSSVDFGPLVRQGATPGPRLIIGDQAAIELFTSERAGLHDHRMALLARSGDTVVLRRRDPDFESYLADCLRFRSVSFIEADIGDAMSVAHKCRTDPRLAARLAAALPATGPLTIHAYLTTGHTWRLAQALGEARQSLVHVAGPGPRVSRRANDKLWFWSLARAIAGRDSVPPTLYAFGPAAAAGQVAKFAKSFESIVVKVPSSAGGKGNVRIASADIRGKSLTDVMALLHDRLAATGWRRSYPILVGVWESGVIQSPSAQIWIPAPADGPPRILGLFEQIVEGLEGGFVGARPARLSTETAREMLTEAKNIAAVLQRIGYFGPCALDAVIRVSGTGENELHWIECNGRWSGVSIPLEAARSLRGGSDPKGLVIAQEILPSPPLGGSSALCALLQGLLFRSGETEEGIVIVSPPNTAQRSSFNVMAIAGDQAGAEALIKEARDRLRQG